MKLYIPTVGIYDVVYVEAGTYDAVYTGCVEHVHHINDSHLIFQTLDSFAE